MKDVSLVVILKVMLLHQLQSIIASHVNHLFIQWGIYVLKNVLQLLDIIMFIYRKHVK